MKSLKLISQIIFFGILLLIVFLWHGDVVRALSDVRLQVQEFADRTFSYESFKMLQLENKRLASEIEVLKSKSVVEESGGGLLAFVYSRYPFNDRSLVVINRGARDGVREGMAVVLESNVVFGRITKVRQTQSEVQTIFDPEWKSSVAIGPTRVKALLRGGGEPKLEFIPHEAKLQTGMNVVNTSPEIPLHLFVGTLKTFTEDPSNAWANGILEAPYVSDDIQSVNVLTKFP